MTTIETSTTLGDVLGRRTGKPRVGRAFLAILGRDIVVTGKEIGAFLAQVLLQPLFILFVFGKVLADLGFTTNDYAMVLLPGVISLTAFLTALQSTSFPLAIDFSWTKEIEDRLLAPLPTDLVAVEKIVYATLRALVAAVIMFPLAYVVLGSLSLSWSDVPMLAVFLVLGSLVGSAVGLTLGTFVEPQRMQLVFALVLTPLLFTGSVQFPWPALEHLRWFQVISALNPMTYLSEGLRGQMLPDSPHIATWICLLALAGFLTVFTVTGAIGFRRRALD
ncbi:MAG TPA: ABC transporter permease [Jiangellaceae bacterium]